MSQSVSPEFSARWERPAISTAGDRAVLMLRIKTAAAANASTSPPIDVAFALDRSGSMAGEPIRLVKQAVEVAGASLRTKDRVALVVYDDRIDVIRPLQPTSATMRNDLRRALDGIDARGSTNLCDGWLTACQQLAGSGATDNGNAGRLQRSLLLTDGLANVGTTSQDELVTHAHQLRKWGITTSTLGVGDGFDEVLLASMAEAGGGNFQFIPSPDELPAFFERELGGLLSTVAANLRVFVTLPSSLSAELISAFPCERVGSEIEVAVGDLPENDEISLIFDIATPEAISGTGFQFGIRCEWIDAESNIQQSMFIAVGQLLTAPIGSSTLLESDSDVSEQSALQHAAQEQREAMRLDREGRYSDSRRRHRQAADILAAAPRTGVVAFRLQEAGSYADFDPAAAMPETVRKQAVHDSMRRTRGRSDQS